MAKGKGKEIRPCTVCGEPIRYEVWEHETNRSNGKIIYHWANEDGSHHSHTFKPANQFPSQVTLPDFTNDKGTLRDKFAIAAMHAILTKDDGLTPTEDIARWSFEVADAMMDGRSK